MTAQEKARENLDRIEAALDRLGRCLEQDKADLGRLGWGNVDDLEHIARQLEQVVAFLTQTEETR